MLQHRTQAPASRERRRSSGMRVQFNMSLKVALLVFSTSVIIAACFTSVDYARSGGTTNALPRPWDGCRGSWAMKRARPSLRDTSLHKSRNGGGSSSSGNIKGGKTLSTKHILNPELYLSRSSHLTPSEEPVPLFSGLRLLIRSLESILATSSSDDSILNHLEATTVLRIEQSISAVHSTDPLCWIHAQQRAVDNLRRTLRNSCDSNNADCTLPVIYFSDAERNVEASALGKASPAYSDSWDPFVGKRIWDNINGNSANGNGGDHHLFKETELPPGARIYGGSRFDWQHYHRKMSHDSNVNERPYQDDWDGFGGEGGGYWILPAVELRRETVDEIGSKGANNARTKAVTLAIHLHNVSPYSVLSQRDIGHRHHRQGWHDAASHVLTILKELTDQKSPAVPCTTLPPVLTRSESTGKGDEGFDSGLAFERGVTEALRQIQSYGSSDQDADQSLSLRKVVLARKIDLNLGAPVRGLDILMRMKYGGHIGHLFYLNPGEDSANDIPLKDEGQIRHREFLGCTPERLFSVKSHGRNRLVSSEALAGTRTRGLTPSADAELLRELLSSKKDMLENEITGQFIKSAFLDLEKSGWLEKSSTNDEERSHHQRYFVRRLRNLQHICQTFEGKLSQSANVIDVSRSLLSGLHPTPAVCGDSPAMALDFIRKYETLGFDRGYYAGPFGYIGHDSADVVVAIRSALVTNYESTSYDSGGPSRIEQLQSSEGKMVGNLPESKVSVFGGAGIVDGSTVQGEWTETSHKMGVLSSLFPSSPITLQSYSTPNVAWTAAFIEELVRSGVTQFYICPGSRNTPITAAIFKTMRSNVGVVRATSVHDERGAGFRAVGYARQNGRPAAVVTSSGTAVANLYPSVVESSSDGVPLLLLTADRPYENRDNGSNQSIDQVKIFSSSYVRWFRDILPPSDDVPVSLALSDANHAVALSKHLMGPVHLNVQFRENLAPDGGPIRNDDRIGSTTKFHNLRFTDVPGFLRWSRSGNSWQDTYYPNDYADHSIMKVAELVRNSRRGIIVTGNFRGGQTDGDGMDLLSETIAHFAKVIGFPIFAGVQSGALRRENPVVPYAEHLLKNPLVSKGMRPDLILQFGSPLISAEISQVIKSNPSARHVLVQKLYPHERANPDFTVTHSISSDVGLFVNNMISHLERTDSLGTNYGSELTTLLYLGRELKNQIPSIIHKASGVNPNEEGDSGGRTGLTEPQVMLAISEVLSESSSEHPPMSMFLSNSMPVRDGEFFFYPPKQTLGRFPLSISVNRGASGIDGIISTATGCGDNSKPITLVCGDVTTLHDLNAFYGLTQEDSSSNGAHPAPHANQLPLTTVVVNNGGGAIFSFLPISKHGQDIGFEEYWGTPTTSFSFEKGALAFGLPHKSASSFEAFKDAYRSSIEMGGPAIIEANVVDRTTNVEVHQKITRWARSVIDTVLGPPPTRVHMLPLKRYERNFDIEMKMPTTIKRTLLLVHGWMGDKSEWDLVGETLSDDLSEDWEVISLDLPGHGESSLVLSSDQQAAHSSLGLDAMRPLGSNQNTPFSLDMIARAVCSSLIKDHGVKHLDAIAGYSLGGRVALAMKRLHSIDAGEDPTGMLVTDQTKMILLGSSPGSIPPYDSRSSHDDRQRLSKDFSLAESLFSSAYRSYLISDSEDEETLTKFLTRWYDAKPLWGDLKKRQPIKYRSMLSKRLRSLAGRRQDIACVLYSCSPPLTSHDDWKFVVPSKTLFVAGGLDEKYSSIGRSWEEMKGIAKYIEVANSGHALLVEEPQKISSIISGFVSDEAIDDEEEGVSQTTVEELMDLDDGSSLIAEEVNAVPLQLHQVGIMEYEAFSITIGSNGEGVQGIGWGQSARPGSELKQREGFIISIASRDGMAVGVGEVSPLKGLHEESLEESDRQLQLIQSFLTSDAQEWPQFDVARVLSLDGSLTQCIDSVFELSGIDKTRAAPSVRSGLEMSILSVSSQLYGTLLPQALAANHWHMPRSPAQSSFGQLPINGLITRGGSAETSGNKKISFQSLKVKTGHIDVAQDAINLKRLKESSWNGQNIRLRADANRAWDIESARLFASELKKAGESFSRSFEFIEEPLEAQIFDGTWSLDAQVTALDDFTNTGDLNYALDESLADLVALHDSDFDRIASDLRKVFGGERAGQTGCAAFVLKPALLGLELSMQLANLAQEEFQISPVFSSSFDSGIGLAYTAILAAVSDKCPYSTTFTGFSHGLGTFDMFGGDTLSPPFESYVSRDGMVNVPSLSRALYGLSLDEMSDRLPTYETVSTSEEPVTSSSESDSYLATTSTTGRDITVSVSLPLPFSANIASSRFTDLPQMSRWSPWLNSVAYLDESPGLTEWNLNIRGVKFSWKAKSKVLDNPKGITWESVSGLKNRGIVEFEPTSDDSCTMKLKMSIIMPYILVSLFQGMPSVVHEFLQNKLLKWSLEMFRDVVKADLALERGDQELGDALFGAVEGRANALEEALK